MGGSIIMDMREVRWEDMAWMCLAEDRDQWQVLVNLIMNIYVL
jgi:hypothetical protein